jgi:copper chaperone NosL
MRKTWLLMLLLFAGPAAAATLDLPQPAPTTTCPVCGMFVTKYSAWVATVLYQDGHAHHFDGAKDLFKYLFDLTKWAPGHRAEDIRAIGVTHYYGLEPIDARQAFYVIGSDVLGPMGHELVPLETREEAEEFLRDHQGKAILRFDEIKKGLPERLDAGQFP